MVKVDALHIQFSHPDGVYFAGQQVQGLISLTLTHEKRINEILLELKGKAVTYWTKHKGKSRKHCSDSEPYFCEQFNTDFTHSFGEEQEREIPAGTHQIPFKYNLPRTLPSSFEGEFGYVRYTCKAILERPWDYDIMVREAFTVIGIEDLNENLSSRDSVSLENSSFDVKFCCRNQGSISVSLSLPKSGYVPGETLPINAQVDNKSSKSLKYTCARIKQHICYRAKTFSGVEMTKEVTREIVKKDKGGIAAFSNERWECEKLPLPPVPPKLVRCRIIDISYTLEFEVDPGIVVMTPINVGTIPFIDDSPSHPSTNADAIVVTVTDADTEDVAFADEETDNTTTPLISALKPNALPIKTINDLYPTLTPPTFEDDFWGPADISNDKETVHFGNSKFTPKYACYKYLP